MPYTYHFPRPTVTVDSVVLRADRGKIEVLLIRRGRPPFEGLMALPGGFLDIDEAPAEGAARELLEETQIGGIELFPLFACGEPNRDPRARCITLVYGALISGAKLTPHGGDDAAEAFWHTLFNPPTMAFDHTRILRETAAHLCWQARTAVIGRNYLPPSFKSDELATLHKIALNQTVISDDPLERGLKLRLLETTDQNGYFKFTTKTFPGPDWDPAPW